MKENCDFKPPVTKGDCAGMDSTNWIGIGSVQCAHSDKNIVLKKQI